MLPSLGTGPTFPSAAADKGEGQLSRLPQVVKGKGQRSGIFPLPIPTHNKWVVGPALPAHPMLWPIRAAALCCPGKLSWVLQSGRGRNSSPALRISGPALALATGDKEQWGRATLPCPCHHMENEGQVFISSALILRDSSPATVSRGQLYCTAKQNIRLASLSSAACEGHDHFSLLLETVMGGAKSVHPSPLSLQ